MNRQKKVLQEFRSHFEKLKKEKILIYGRGMYARLILQNFQDYSFVGIIDRLDLEGSCCGVPVLKYEQVLQSGVKVIMIAASYENTELIRKRIGNFCIRNQIRLFSVDGRCLNVDDCVLQETVIFPNGLSRKHLNKVIKTKKTIFFELKVLFMKKGRKTEFRTELLNGLRLAVCMKKKVVLLITSYEDAYYQVFHEMEPELEKELLVCVTETCGIYHKLMQLAGLENTKNCFYIGSEGNMIANNLGIQDFKIYTPIKMLANSSYQDLWCADIGWLEQIYVELIACKLFASPYALSSTSGKVRIKEPYDIGYIFLGPLIMDFMIWFIEEIRENQAGQVIFSARDGYLFQKLYEGIRKRKEQPDLPNSVYVYTSRMVCKLASVYSAVDIEKQLMEYFKGNLKEMLRERFMLSDKLLDSDIEGWNTADKSYIKKFENDILEKALEVRENYSRYLDTLPLEVNKKIVFFDLFASGTCQSALEKINGKKYKGLYFTKYWTQDPEKQKLDIGEYMEYQPFMGDHSLLIECILTSPEPTLRYINQDGALLFQEETRSNEELLFMHEAQRGVTAFVEEVLQCCEKLPDRGTSGYGIQVFEKIVSKYTEIENTTLKNMVIHDEILHRDQYLGDFYKY